MSIGSIQRQIESAQKDIEALNRQLSSEASKEAQKSGRIASINRSITSSTSLSTIKSKQSENQRLENDIVSIQKKKADIQKKIADKTARLHRYQQDLMKEQTRETKKFQDTLRQSYSEQFARPHSALTDVSRAISRAPDAIVITQEHDAFISHASEDKDELVRPLANALQKAGHNIWYDEFSLTIGDSLRKSIDKGLANSRFGIVVLSPDFFAKQWTEYELNGLVAREIEGGKVILPIWHKVSKDQVLRFSPTLADKLALNTAMFTIEELASKLGEVIRGV
jgi:Skp family chaperone for outer membrane proteins